MKLYYYLSYQVCVHIRVLHPGLQVADGAANVIHHYFNLWQHCLKLGLQDRQDSSIICVSNLKVLACEPVHVYTLARSLCIASKISFSLSSNSDIMAFSWVKRNWTGRVTPERKAPRNLSSTCFWLSIVRTPVLEMGLQRRSKFVCTQYLECETF